MVKGACQRRENGTCSVSEGLELQALGGLNATD